MHRFGVCVALVVSTTWNFAASTRAPAQEPAGGNWIWYDEGDPLQAAPAEPRYFRKMFDLADAVDTAVASITCDNDFTLYVNGERVGSSGTWERGSIFKVADKLRRGKNVLAVRAANREGPAGLFCSLDIKTDGGKRIEVATDASWRAARSAAVGWRTLDFADASWKPAKVLGPYGIGPWNQGIRWGASNPGRFKVPDGFAVTRVAAHDITGSVVAMTFDHRARVVVSREGGPVLVLKDTDGDGEADQAVTFTDKVTNCQGLCFIDGALYAVGNGPQGTGLYRLRDTDGDDRADTIEVLGKFHGGMGEHGPHAVLPGPDGWLYVVLGNHTRPASAVAPDSPLNRYAEGQVLPRYADAGGHAHGVMTPGGTVVRLDYDGNRWTRVAGGFRNEYDIAFNAAGEMFTYDSDMEWDIGLPWYRPTRVNHVVPSGDYGWRHGSGKWPGFYVDSLPTTVDIGRGSPTGVLFYQHDQFPQKYQGAFFASDWSMGRILVVFPQESGATYTGTWEAFATGRPLNVTDLAVSPTGDLYFSTGGRNTEGAVFRITYTDAASLARPARPAPLSADAAVRQLQPDAAWARASIRRTKAALGAGWQGGLLAIAHNTALPPNRRSRALLLLQQFGPAPHEAILFNLSRDRDPPVRNAATYLLGLRKSEAARIALLGRLGDRDASVRRRACEAFVRNGLRPPMDVLLPRLGDADRWVRYAARNLLQRIDPAQWRRQILASNDANVAIQGMLALLVVDPQQASASDVAAKQAALLGRGLPVDVLLDLIRLTQVATIHGNGALAAEYRQMRPALLAAFDQDDARVKREVGRLLAAWQEPRVIGKLLDAIEADESRDAQIHYAYCLRAITTGWTKPQRERIADWFGTTRGWPGGHSFNGYLDILWNATLALLPAEERDEILAELDEPLDADDPIANAIAQAKAARNQHDPAKLRAFLLDDPAGRRGDAKRGRAVFKLAGCAACHKFGDLAPGRGVGPDLTTIAARFKRSEILESILEPDKVLSDQYKAINILTTDGAVITGIPLRQDAKEIVLQRTNGTEITFPKSEIARTGKATSMMPAGTLNVLTLAQIADLFAFLEATPAP